MRYKTLIINMIGQSPSGMMAAIEAQMNTAADDGYKYIHGWETENRVYIIMGKSLEVKRGPGRPRKIEEGEEQYIMEG